MNNKRQSSGALKTMKWNGWLNSVGWMNALSLGSELWYFWPLALKLNTQCKLQIDFDFIRELEGSRLQGYVPNPETSNSGVTIGTGFDLGARNLADLNNLGLSSSLIDKFKPYLGLKKSNAVKKLDDIPLSITSSEAEVLEEKVKVSETNKIITYFDQSESTVKFKCLPAQAQTVIAFVSYQYGYLPRRTAKFWATAITQDWQKMYEILNDFHDKYKTRRQKEAKLIEELL